MREFLATNDPMWKSFFLVVIGLVFFWICSLVLTRPSKRPVRWVALILTITPLMYLGVHVFYNVSTYYPRHIIAGYIAFGVTSIYLLSPKAQREFRSQRITAVTEQ